MQKPTSALAMAIALGALLTTAAAASAATQVSITSWKVMTTNGNVHKAKPGATVKVCATHPADNLSAKGMVQGAKKGRSFREVWTADGKPYAKFSETWRKSGSFTTSFSVGAEGLAPAKYRLRLVEGSKTIGASAITLKTKAC